MKLYLLAAISIFFQNAYAGIGGSSGGSSNTVKVKYITTEVCDSDAKCRMVTYRVRPPSKPVNEKPLCSVDDQGYEKCNPHAHVPRWLIELSENFPGEPQQMTEEDRLKEIYRN